MSHRRFWLWVDGVGGYLVCEADSIVIGQPASDDSVDVPILADLSRRHATVRRQGDAYLFEAAREARLNGRVVEQPALLGRDALLELGSTVRLRFRQPHPLSLSARLELASHHRTQPSTSGIVLAHETLILGPALSSHVVCPGWKHELVLFRAATGPWFCRATGVEFEVDGQAVKGRAQLGERSRIVGPDFSISLEPYSNPGRVETK
ncbi:MAG: hypothetical protein JNM18_16000 [Planctomycetaceae bacterium]|nr:hypothetical protein [Planctomycetaceae bacterium]